MPVARGVRLVRSNPPPPLASEGVRLVQYTIYDIAYIHHIPYIEPPKLEIEPPPPASEEGFDWFDIYHTSNRRAGHGDSVPLLEINGARKIAPTTNYPPSNLRNINDYPPSRKSARKIAPTTPPPRIYGTSTTTPPRNRPGKSLQLPPLEFTEHHRLPPPPRKSNPPFQNPGYGPVFHRISNSHSSRHF